MSGVEGALSFSRRVDVVGGDVHKLMFEGYRDVIEGAFSSYGPWATAGVNFYNQFGRKLSEETIEVNSANTDPSDQIRSRSIVVPESVTTAYIWVWIDKFDSGTDIPVRVRDLQLSRVEINDTSPPTATLNPFSVVESPGAQFFFAIDFEDDVRLGQFGGYSSNAIQITGPNGFNAIAPSRAGVPGNTDTFQKVIFGVPKPDGSDWSEADNGIYTVTLAENSLIDQAGNIAPGNTLGQFEVKIPVLVADTVAPEISFVQRATQTIPGSVDLTVLTFDDQDDNVFAGRITVFNETSFATEVTGIAGGFDSELNQNFEIFSVNSPTGQLRWTAEDNGTYFVRLEDGVLSDDSGNFTPAQVLGSFVIEIPE